MQNNFDTTRSDLDKFEEYAKLRVKPAAVKDFMVENVAKYASQSEITARQIHEVYQNRNSFSAEEKQALADAFLQTDYAKKRGITAQLPKQAADLEKVTPLHIVMVDAQASNAAGTKERRSLQALQKQMEQRLNKEEQPSFWQRYNNLRKAMTFDGMIKGISNSIERFREMLRRDREQRVLDKANAAIKPSVVLTATKELPQQKDTKLLAQKAPSIEEKMMAFNDRRAARERATAAKNIQQQTGKSL